MTTTSDLLDLIAKRTSRKMLQGIDAAAMVKHDDAAKFKK
jgi:hypothetical protein